MRTFDNDYIFYNKTDARTLLSNVGNDLLKNDTDSFNCGSFALGIFSRWYCPYDRYSDNYDCVIELREAYDDGEIGYDECCDEMADLYINHMCETLVTVREITRELELDDDEYLVAFKASPYDFHYARRMDNGDWFHKMGGSEIEKISKYDVYNDNWWAELCCEYGGALRLLAVKKPNFKQMRLENKLFKSLANSKRR